MDIGMFLIENALEIMYLCIGLGVLLLTVSVSRTLAVVRRTAQKVEDIVDLLDNGIRKPAEMLVEVGSYIAPIIKHFKKK